MTDGKKHVRALDLTGQKFGLLTAVSREGLDANRHHMMWRFECQCGASIVRSGTKMKQEVMRGGTPNCGCATASLMRAKLATHGMTKHPGYAVWRAMKDRCHLPSHRAYKNYGARGIQVCDAWRNSFEAFWLDMGGTYVRGLDLDRVDNDGPYAPSNCRWVDRRANTMNKRSTIREADIPQLSRESGISRSTLYYRVKHGWPVTNLLEKPSPSNRCSTSSTAAQDKGLS